MTVQRRQKVKQNGTRYKVKAEKHKGTTGQEEEITINVPLI
jgi:hypothetical protein